MWEICDQNNWDEIILKPCISAGSVGVVRLKKNDLINSSLDLVSQILNKQEPYMMQPFVESILTHGELSLLYFNGKYSYAIKKTLKEGSFNWGNYKPVVADSKALDMGEYIMKSALDIIPFKRKRTTESYVYPLLYARIDLLKDANGSYVLGELEIFEPCLYFNFLQNTDKVEQVTSEISDCVNLWLQKINERL